MKRLETILLALFASLVIAKPTQSTVSYPEGYDHYQPLEHLHYDDHTNNSCEDPRDSCRTGNNYLDNRVRCTIPLSEGEGTMIENGCELFFYEVEDAHCGSSYEPTALFSLLCPEREGSIVAADICVTASNALFVPLDPRYYLQNDLCYESHIFTIAVVSGKITLGLELE
tara:strand:+ start:69 stop:578 length:510 start_codon:yes stop_codon:yes gene_type:complete